MAAQHHEAAAQPRRMADAVDPGDGVGHVEVLLEHVDGRIDAFGGDHLLPDPAGFNRLQADRGAQDHAGQAHGATDGVEGLGVA
jgi:hypothetical protein